MYAKISKGLSPKWRDPSKKYLKIWLSRLSKSRGFRNTFILAGSKLEAEEKLIPTGHWPEKTQGFGLDFAMGFTMDFAMGCTEPRNWGILHEPPSCGYIWGDFLTGNPKTNELPIENSNFYMIRQVLPFKGTNVFWCFFLRWIDIILEQPVLAMISCLRLPQPTVSSVQSPHSIIIKTDYLWKSTHLLWTIMYDFPRDKPLNAKFSWRFPILPSSKGEPSTSSSRSQPGPTQMSYLDHVLTPFT